MKRAGLAFSVLMAVVGFANLARATVPGLEDPTRPLVSRSSEPRARTQVELPQLTSVLIGKDRKLAVIDGRLMSEGEERQGVKVWKIEGDHAVISLEGRGPVTLTLDNARVHKESR